MINEDNLKAIELAKKMNELYEKNKVLIERSKQIDSYVKSQFEAAQRGTIKYESIQAASDPSVQESLKRVEQAQKLRYMDSNYNNLSDNVYKNGYANVNGDFNPYPYTVGNINFGHTVPYTANIDKVKIEKVEVDKEEKFDSEWHYDKLEQELLMYLIVQFKKENKPFDNVNTHAILGSSINRLPLSECTRLLEFLHNRNEALKYTSNI